MVLSFPLPPSLQGMLNVWHLVAYQRYYDGLIAATAPASAAGAAARQQQEAAAQHMESLNASGTNIVDVSSGWE